MGVKHIELSEGALTHSVLGAFFNVYNNLGFGFLESVYVAALVWELSARAVVVEREVDVRVRYKGEDIARQRIDLLVGRRVIVEVKTGPVMLPVARRQLRNYLRATNLEVGLLLHFGPKPEFSREFFANAAKASDQTHSLLQTDPG